MIHLFAGWDKREADGYHVFCHSVISRATKPVAITPLSGLGLAEGSNAFTLSRFMVPKLMGFQGHAIFADASDMLMLEDVAVLDMYFDPEYAIQVVKHPDYKTRHRTKYRGTDMECPNSDYSRKNWASVCIFNCAHPAWAAIASKPEAKNDALYMLGLKFLRDEDIGAIPADWNRLVDEGHEITGAKVLHWTAGMPGFTEYENAPGAQLWHRERMEAFGSYGR